MSLLEFGNYVDKSRVGPVLVFLPDAECFSNEMPAPDNRHLPGSGLPDFAGLFAGFPDECYSFLIKIRPTFGRQYNLNSLANTIYFYIFGMHFKTKTLKHR